MWAYFFVKYARKYLRTSAYYCIMLFIKGGIMRIRKAVSRGCEHYAIIQDINVNGKRTTKIFENLGNWKDVEKRYPLTG